MRFVITGAAGFIGSHLSESLVRDAHEVVGIDVLDDFYDREIKLSNLRGIVGDADFSFHEADVRDAPRMEQLFDGADAVVHLAARAGVRPSMSAPELYFDVNVRGTAVVLDTMARLQIPRLAFASSSSIYGEGLEPPFSEAAPLGVPASPYAATKLAGEVLCRAYAGRIARITALRFFSVYGPRQRPDLALHGFSTRMLAGDAIPILGETTSFRDYTYIDDIVDGVRAALELEEPWAVLNLGSGRPITLETMISELEHSLGRPAQRELLPPNGADMFGTWADISEAERVLDFEPSLSFSEGVRMFTDWLVETAHPLTAAA